MPVSDTPIHVATEEEYQGELDEYPQQCTDHDGDDEEEEDMEEVFEVGDTN